MPKTIKETKVTCNSCGNVYFFGKEEEIQNKGQSVENFGRNMMRCTGCIPLWFIKDKEAVDFDRCPKCNSRNVKKEQVVHNVE